MVAGFGQAGVDVSGVQFSFARGSVIVTAAGPVDALAGLDRAVEEAEVQFTINGQVVVPSPLPASTSTTSPPQTITAGQQPIGTTTGGSSSGGQAAAIGAAVGVLIAVGIVVGVVLFRKHQNEHGTYEVDEAAHAQDIIDEELSQGIYGEEERRTSQQFESFRSSRQYDAAGPVYQNASGRPSEQFGSSRASSTYDAAYCAE